jgi:hypothetical protein
MLEWSPTPSQRKNTLSWLNFQVRCSLRHEPEDIQPYFRYWIQLKCSLFVGSVRLWAVSNGPYWGLCSSQMRLGQTIIQPRTVKASLPMVSSCAQHSKVANSSKVKESPPCQASIWKGGHTPWNSMNRFHFCLVKLRLWNSLQSSMTDRSPAPEEVRSVLANSISTQENSPSLMTWCFEERRGMEEVCLEIKATDRGWCDRRRASFWGGWWRMLA